jgi:nicotinamide mononucleotide adenylyltransferase
VFKEDFTQTCEDIFTVKSQFLALDKKFNKLSKVQRQVVLPMPDVEELDIWKGMLTLTKAMTDLAVMRDNWKSTGRELIAKSDYKKECQDHIEAFNRELKKRNKKSKGRQFVATPTTQKAKKSRLIK